MLHLPLTPAVSWGPALEGGRVQAEPFGNDILKKANGKVNYKFTGL